MKWQTRQAKGRLLLLPSFTLATGLPYFIYFRFPVMRHGKRYGIGMAIAAVFGCLQYALFAISENSLKKDHFLERVLFVCITVKGTSTLY